MTATLRHNLCAIPLHALLLAGMLPETTATPLPPGTAATPPAATKPATATATSAAAFLGIETTPLEPAVATALRLADGTGLRVRFAAPGTPAAALLKPGDILLLLDEQILCNPEQLRVLVRAKKPGDTVKLSLRRNTEPLEIHVTLGPVPAGLRDTKPWRWRGNLPPSANLRELLKQHPDVLEFADSDEVREHLKVLEREINQHHRDIEKTVREKADDLQNFQKRVRPHVNNLEQKLRQRLQELEIIETPNASSNSANPDAKGNANPAANANSATADASSSTANPTTSSNPGTAAAAASAANANANSPANSPAAAPKVTSTCIVSDGDGTASLSIREGCCCLKVQDTAGKVLFDGPVDTPAQRAALAPEIANRLKMVEQLVTIPTPPTPPTDAPPSPAPSATPPPTSPPTPPPTPVPPPSPSTPDDSPTADTDTPIKL